MITKPFKEFLLSETLLSIIWLKYFYFAYRREIAFSITFRIFFIETIHQYSEVEGFSIIFSTVSRTEKNIAPQFKICYENMLCFHRFIIIFKLTLQQRSLWLSWTKLENFVQKLCGFSIVFAFEDVYQQFFMKKEHSTVFICS